MAPAFAQALRLGAWDGSVESRLDVGRQEATSGRDSSRSRFDTLQAQELMTIRNTGTYVLDPRLFTLTLGGTFGLSQERVSATPGQDDSRDGTLWGYEASAGLLSGHPVSLSLFANRRQTVQTQVLTGRSDLLSENRGATLFLNRLYVPSRISLRQELTDDEFRVVDAIVRRQEERRSLTYEGQRGWENAELGVWYEYVDFIDRVFPGLSYRSHEPALTFSLEFGPELNWRWDSRLRYFTRAGERVAGISPPDLTTWSVDESLEIEHTERLRSRYQYLLLQTETPGGETTSHTLTGSLRHQLYESLSTTVAADVSYQTIPEGDKRIGRSRVDSIYTKRLPGEGRLSIGLGAGLQYEDDRLRARESFVAQEQHRAGIPFALPLALDNLFVVEASVIVTKVAAGPTPAGCVPPGPPPILLVLGRDYTLRTVDTVTEVVPIPCGGAIPGINPGDTIAVDYRFGVAPAREFTTTSWRADVSADYGWVRLFAAYDRSDQSLLSGQDGKFLQDQQTTSAGLELRYDRSRITASALGEWRRFLSTTVSYDSYRASQLLRVSLLDELTLTLSGFQTRFDYLDQDRHSLSLGGRLTLTYGLNGYLFGEMTAGVQELRDTVLPRERLMDAGLRVRWVLRKLEISPSVQFLDRERGDTHSRDIRATLQMIRRF